MTASKAVFLFSFWLFAVYTGCTGSIREATQPVSCARKGAGTKHSESYAVLNAGYEKSSHCFIGLKMSCRAGLNDNVETVRY